METINQETKEPEVINLDTHIINPAWRRQRERQGKHLPLPVEMVDLAMKFDNIRNRALFILAYLTAGRISELVRYRKVKYGMKEVIIIRNGKAKKQRIQDWRKRKIDALWSSSITRQQIAFTKKDDRPVLLIRMRNLKSRKRHEKDIPIPLDSQENIAFYNMLKEFLNKLDLEDELFPFSYQNAHKIIKKTGFNCHSLRHIRLTHLSTLYDFNEQLLRIYAGWTDSRPSYRYVEANWGDILKKL